MTYALSIAFWAIWRRWQGAGNTGPRWLKVAIAGAVIAGSVYCVTGFHVDSILLTVGLCGFTALFFLPHNIYDPDTEGFNKRDPRNWGHWLAKRAYPQGCWSCIGEVYRGALFGLVFGLILNLL